MNSAPKRQARRIILDCEHELWLVDPYPSESDHLWCAKCGTYVRVGPSGVRIGKTWYPDYQWSCEPQNTGFLGVCELCGHAERHRNWHKLRDDMERHYLRKHSGSSLAASMEVVPIPRKDYPSEPPF